MKPENRERTSWKKRTAVLMRCLACCFAFSMLTACGKQKAQGKGAAESSQSVKPGQFYYHFQEAVLPSYEGIPNVFEQEYTVSGNVSRLCGDTFYRWVQYSTTEEPFQRKNYFQIMEPPYQEWVAEEVGSCEDVPVLIAGVREGALTVILRSRDPGENGQYLYYPARWQPGTGSLEPLADSGFEGDEDEFSDNAELFLVSDGRYVSYDSREQGTVVLYDEHFQPEGNRRLEEGARICGILQDPESGGLLWYGIRNRQAGVWNLEDGTPFLKEGQSLGAVNAMSLHGTYDADGVLYLADNRFLWRVEQGEAEEACSFFDRDYPLSALYAMGASEDGSLLLYTNCTKELALRVERNREPLPEKREIVIASTDLYNALETAIGEFNRTSERYRVKMEYPYDPYSPMPADAGELSAEFWSKVQMEISAGRGPDMFLSDYSGKITALAEEGCLQDLGGILEDGEDFWPAAMEAGKIGGVQYGLPYFARFYLTAYSREYVGDRTSFTLPELMETVRESGAKVLQWGYDGTEIVLYYGLYDNDNRDFIDWEAGKSRLTEEPFREFLEFAREYANPVDFDFPDWEDAAKAVAEGKTFAAHNFMAQSWGTIWGGDPGSLETIFQGDPVCIGYPRSEGNGIYVDPPLFFVNVNSQCKEGAEEFLRFLLSKENQRLFLSDIIIGNVGTPPQVPVRLSILEESIDLARERKEQGAVGNSFLPAMTQEQAQAARFLIENARPANWKVSEIEDFFYEELPPYFEGRRSLDETVEILDNRVQLFLDEQK